jgi:hypothetical protein
MLVHNAVDPAARERFCVFLRSKREAAALSIEEIANVTRIPERSLRRLEAGAFEELPGDIFVRGFVRSYAQCVGVDPDDAIRRYAAVGLTPAPVASKEAERISSWLAAARSDDDPNVKVPRRQGGGAPMGVPAILTAPPETDRIAGNRCELGRAAASQQRWEHCEGDEELEAARERAPSDTAIAESTTPVAEQSQSTRRIFVPPSLFDDSGPRRGHLTLAVIILAIVATLTMSYLMRRPSDPGEGVTENEVRADQRVDRRALRAAPRTFRKNCQDAENTIGPRRSWRLGGSPLVVT